MALSPMMKQYNEIKAQLGNLSPQEQNKLKGTIRNIVKKTMGLIPATPALFEGTP